MIGTTLKAARLRRGLSLGALALKAGVSKSTLSRWEAGKSVPYATELGRVMETLGLSEAERRRCWQALEAPRALTLAQRSAGAGTAPVSSGELLRALRVRSGLSQGRVARAAEVTQGMISRWEAGECWPDGARLHSLCFVLGATEEELVFLTTRGWQQQEPLPDDKAALDGILDYLEYNDLSRDRGLVYLALAGRYQSLHLQGKLDSVEVSDVWGRYAYYLCWRLGRYSEALHVVAPARRTLFHSKRVLSRGQLEAVAALSEALEGHLAEATLRAVFDRIPESRHSWWCDFLAQTLLKQNLPEPAYALQNEGIQSARNDYERLLRQSRLAGMYCERREYRSAVHLLSNLPRSADVRNPYRHTAIEAQNDTYLAVAFHGLGQRSEALHCLQRTEPYLKAGVGNPAIHARIHNN